MRRLLKLLPVSRVGMILWAWRHRESIVDWLGFAVRAAGRPREDVRAEFQLRVRLRRFPVTVRVEDGVATLHGQLSPQAHAAVQDAVVAAPGVRRVDDRISNLP